MPVVEIGAPARPAILMAALSTLHVRTATILGDHDSAVWARGRHHDFPQVVCKGFVESAESPKCPVIDGTTCTLLERVSPGRVTLLALQWRLTLNLPCVIVDLDEASVATGAIWAGAHITVVDHVMLQQKALNLIDPFIELLFFL